MAARRDARPLDRTSPMPLWAQLHQDLVRRLAAGAFEAGFPGELELVATYDVSRHTVREAVRRLRQSGLVDSSRGRGSRVRREPIEQPLGGLYSLYREVEARGMVQRSAVLAQRKEQCPDAAANLGLDADTAFFHLERVRYADDVPLAHDRVWLPATDAAALLDADFTRAALYDELAARTGLRLTHGEERIGAVVPTPAQRSLLAVPRGVACFAVERTGRVGTRPVEFRRTLVRGDRWSVVATWSPQGYDLGAEGALSR